MKRIIKTFVLLGFLSLMLGSCDSHNGYVDLGLSVKWATCNVGTRSPEEHGEYYAYDDALQLEKDGKRLPSKLEFRELIDNCDWTWTTRNGVNGYKVTSRKNDNSIFLPAAGVRGVHNGASVTYVDYNGFYWSSSANGDDNAYCLDFGCNYVDTHDDYFRSNGLSVRLVQDVN